MSGFQNCGLKLPSRIGRRFLCWFEIREKDMETNDRKFKAWAIFWRWKDTGVVMPTYKDIDGSFPWFATKRAALAFVRKHKPKGKSDILDWLVKPVTLTMSFEAE